MLFRLMTKIDVKTKVISLKPHLDYDAAEEMVESRKAKLFQTLLHKPKKSEIHLHSLTLHFEAILLLSGKYSVDFIRDASHTLSVDKNVQEVIIKTDKKEIIISKPSVTEMKAKDNSIFQVVAENIEEKELEVQIFSDDDISLVAQQANVDEEAAKNALAEAEGDLARAILLLTTN